MRNKPIFNGNLRKALSLSLSLSLCKIVITFLMFLLILPFSGFSQTYWDTEGNAVAAGKNKLGTSNNFEVSFVTNNLERMRLSNNGFLGIGTTNPQQLLHVNGNIRFSALSNGTQTSAIMIDANGDLSSRSLNIANWNTAFSWGNHASVGYLTTETDPVFIASPSYGISSTNITNWNVAYAWGNHAGLYRSITWDPLWTEIIGKPDFAQVAYSGDYSHLINTPNIVDSINTFAFNGDYNSLTNLPSLNITNWNAAYSWGDHAAAEYLTEYTETDPIFTATFEITNPQNGQLLQYNDSKWQNFNHNFISEYQNLVVSDNLLGLTNSTSYISLESLNYWSKLNDNLYYNNGSVGIGTSAPNKLLHLHSESTYSPAAEIITTNSTISLLKGTPIKPINKLNSESTLLLTNKFSGSDASDGLLIRSYNNNAVISLQEEGSLSLITKHDLRFKMESNGNVSIGKSETNYFTVNKNGNVGIGTDEPAATLHVKGNKVIIERNEKYIHINASNPNAEIGSSTGEIKFWYTDGVGYNNIFSKDIISYGNVGIGLPETEVPQYKLDVRGTGHFFKVIVKTEGFSDYVFDEDYELMPLEELSIFINTNKHLPNIPSESEVVKDGSFELGEMNKLLLEKIEELTLYIIQQDERIRNLEDRINK